MLISQAEQCRNYVIKLGQSFKIINKVKLTMDKIARLLQKPHREFRYMDSHELPQALLNQYNSSVYWTPRYQKIPYTEDLLKYIRYLQRSNKVNYPKMRQFVGHVLTDYYNVMLEDRPELHINIDKDVYIPKNGICPYHGKVDWVYSVKGYNMTPVMFYDYSFNPIAGIAMALSNMYIRNAMKQARQKQFPQQPQASHVNTYGQNNVWGYSIMTTGHTWQIIRIDRNYLLQKSVILEADNKYRSMHHDEEMVSVLLGLFDYCLEMPAMNRKVLEKSYQYIDEQRWMIPGDSNQHENAAWVSKWLLKYYKKQL